SISARPPTKVQASTVASWAQRLGAPSMSARARKGGEKIIDWGSATWGWPLNTKGVHAGDSPRARLCARNWIWGRNCALASQGMVTRPDSQGQSMTSEASRKMAKPNAHGCAIADINWLAALARLGVRNVCGSGVLGMRRPVGVLRLGRERALLYSAGGIGAAGGACHRAPGS